MPTYFANIAYHGQPGGYCHDRDNDYCYASALHEAGETFYSRGAGTGAEDSKGQSVLRFIEVTFPGFYPQGAVDLGCGYGGQTGNYVVGFPDVEIHGVDLGAGLLRYAHSHAKALGQSIQFKQACASATGLPDASFNQVVSNILLHEIPREMLEAVMQESFRLLAISLDDDYSESWVNEFKAKQFPTLMSFNNAELDMDTLVSVIDPVWNKTLPTNFIINRDGEVVKKCRVRHPSRFSGSS